jgi:hypothetical protein
LSDIKISFHADNKVILTLAGLAIVGVAGFALTNNSAESQATQNNSTGLVGAAAVASGGAAPVDVPPNVAEARAWIAAWKKKHGKQ